MAIFASTTTSGYSDPLKAYSIKALEQRQKDMLAQQAQAQAAAFSPENTQTPIQGFGQLANVIGDRVQQGRADSALAAQKSELAQILSGGADKMTPQQQARMAVIAPDMYKDITQQLAEERRSARTNTTIERGQDLQRTSAQEGHQTTERVAQAAAKAAADKANADPVAESKRLEMQKSLTQKQLMADKLERAGEAFNHPGGIYPGSFGRLQAMGAARTGLGDKEKAQRTLLFDDAMNEVSTGKMADVLTGPTTNFELTKFREMGNNPDVSIDERRTQFSRVLAAMRKDRDATAASVKKVGGDPSDPTAAAPTTAPPAATPPAAGGGGAANVPRPAGKNDSELIAAAKAEAEANPQHKAAIEAQLQKWLMGK